jgi:hypothetical protein
MTPADEARFIALWQASARQAAIAEALGSLVGTATVTSTSGGPGGPALCGR